jgi:hypothetical protein
MSVGSGRISYAFGRFLPITPSDSVDERTTAVNILEIV